MKVELRKQRDREYDPELDLIKEEELPDIPELEDVISITDVDYKVIKRGQELTEEGIGNAYVYLEKI